MKRFVCKVLIYGFLILFTAIILDYTITKGLQRVDDFIYQPWTEIKNGNLNNDVLILGNSRAQGHIHPAILDSICECDSYNLGIEAYHMNMHLFKYRYYVEYNNAPKVIIYQVDLSTIASPNIKRGSNSEQFLPLFYNSICRQEFSKWGYNKFDLYCPLYRYFGYHTAIRQGIVEGTHLKHFSVNPAYKGFKGWDYYWDGANVQADMSVCFNATPSDLCTFENFIIQSIENGITVICVYSPMYESLTEQLTDKNAFDAYMNSVSERLGIIYLDYTSNHELCSNSTYYSSPGHLNLKGAQAFSTKLAYDIDSIGLLR